MISLSSVALLMSAAVCVAAVSPRPPMGFNPCFVPHVGCYMINIGEAGLQEMAQAIATNGMLDAGYTLFALDDGWAGPRLPNGTITAAKAGFPSGSLAPLSAYVKSLGLSFGVYTDRGTSTCAGRPGSKGYEALDVATYVSWGIAYVKVDSCTSTQDFPTTLLEYRAFAEPLAAAGMFFSVCVWADWIAGVTPPLGDAWRINQDASEWGRFLENLKSAAAVANLTGPGRGWPDVDMIAGHWSDVQEVTHLSAIAILGSPLLLSFDPRTNSSSTLGLQAYLNPELIAIHQDAPPAGTPYYARIAGDDAQGENATRLVVVDCGLPQAIWTYTPESESSAAGFGTLAVAGGGMCLGLWDLFPGRCVNAVYAGTVPCGANGSLGCPRSAQLWAPGNATNGWELTVALNYSGGTPFPGPLLTSTTVPGSYYAQPVIDGSAQAWVHTLAPGAPGETVIRGHDGLCLAPSPSGAWNVWLRWLEGGDVAILFINFGTLPAAVACDTACMASLPRQGTQPPAVWKARDVWARADFGTLLPSGYVSPVLPADGGSLLLRLTPTGSQVHTHFS